MNDDLEQLLQRQALRQPGDRLDRRMAELFAAAGPASAAPVPARPESPVIRRLYWARWGSAAGIAAVLLLGCWATLRFWQAATTTVAPPPVAKASSDPGVELAAGTHYEQVDARWIDDGPVVLADGKPARRLRQQTVRQIVWHDAQTNRRMEMVLPSEEVVLLQQTVY